ncbi:MAG: M20/M25/M40 family metallo-hydrolase [Cyclobacteriaceae bacterium]|nr:M20/M25/M40 family metallo-hydrolase [Cyclobacteriaceae bacterium]
MRNPLLRLSQCLLLFLVYIPAKSQVTQQLPPAERLQQHVAILASDSLEGRGLGTQGKTKARDYIARQFAEAGLLPYASDYFQHFYLRFQLVTVEASNVIGYVEGVDPVLRNEYIVIGAHYDHLGFEFKDGVKRVYSGADDNASGTAALIEIARHFAANPQLTKRSLIFIAFDAEESGLLGAKRFVEDNSQFSVDQIKAMFSLDMVGKYHENKGLMLKGMGLIKDAPKMALSLANDRNMQILDTSAEVEARTDTWPFGEVGIPAIHVFTGYKHTPYHKPEDKYDLLDYQGMARVTEYMNVLVSAISDMPEIKPVPALQQLQKTGAKKFNSGALISLGNARHQFPDDFVKAKGIFAFNAGLFGQLHLSRKISLQSEVLYDYNGSRSSDGRFYRHSLTIPMHLQWNAVHESAGMVRVFPMAGAYYRYHMAGKTEGVQLDFRNLHMPDEWGLSLGLGVDIMRVHVAYTWRRSFSSAFRTAELNAVPVENNFTIGYKF